MRLFLSITKIVFVVAFAVLVLPVSDAWGQEANQESRQEANQESSQDISQNTNQGIDQNLGDMSMSNIILLASNGNVDAQFEVGKAYFTGNGLPLNKIEAVKFFKMAADQGHIVSETLMGTFYSMGDGGLVIDQAESMKWFRRAAVKGSSNAQLSLGVAYKDMTDTPNNHITAYAWYAISRAQGDELAIEFKDELEQGMSQEDIIAAQKLALQCLASNYENCG